MSWLRRTTADAQAVERTRRAMECLTLENLERLALFAEELAAKQRADKYTDPALGLPWGWP